MEFPTGQHLRGDELARDETVECDVVIIGSGAGGAAAARELSKAGLRVLVLEEGRRWEPKELSTRQSWALRNLYAERGTSIALGNIYLPMPRGRAVGGSTLINSAICFRPPARVLKVWREEHGVPWADEAQLTPVVEDIERSIGVMKCHPAIAKTHNLLFKQGVEALGLEGDFISRNAAGCVGCGTCQLGCPTGGKGSVDRTLLPVALKQGAALFSCTSAAAVKVERGVAVGVEAWGVDPRTEARKRRLDVRAKKVFLAAGAINSPMLLQRQGLAGSSGQLGNNLHVHTASGACARFDQFVDAWHGVTQGYYVFLPGEAAVIETFSTTPDLYAIQWEAFSRPLGQLRQLASSGTMIGDVSSGTVRPGPSPGRSAMTYDILPADVNVLKKGLREIARIYFAAGALAVNLSIVGLGELTSMADVEALLDKELPPDRLAIYASHPMSTCRMNGDRSRGVVRPDGTTWDVENLVVCDASIFPTALGVNPQITVMAAAVLLSRQQLEQG